MLSSLLYPKRASSSVLATSIQSITKMSTSSFRPPTDLDAQALLGMMDHRQGSVVTDPDTLKEYNTDWTNKYKGKSSILCQPKNSNEVASILRYCNEEKIGIVPQAGNTGVVGGATPMDDEVILSLHGLNEIESFDEINGILICGSGCILQKLQDTVGSLNHMVPIDLGSKGSCMIGGNISTNAGGSYYYRFGSIHANIIGLEIALANGSMLDLMNTNRKDNTGYDLKHLFVGAEGTLGVITKVAMSCPRLPTAKNAAFLACETFEAVVETLSLAKKELGETLGAFEFMDKEVLDILSKEKRIPIQRSQQGNSNGSDTNYRFCILVETLGADDEHDKEKMTAFLEEAMERNIVVDGAVSQDLKQVHDMWDIRESCNPIIKALGYNYKYDLSLPIPLYYDIVEETRNHLKDRPDAIVVNWGHVIDGNIHLNIITPGVFEEDADLKALLEPFIFEAVIHRGGSISAEHGLGQQKNKYLGKYAKDPQAVQMMKSLKHLFDPNGILNPGKFLPS